jgi:hypothetical protein
MVLNAIIALATKSLNTSWRSDRMTFTVNSSIPHIVEFPPFFIIFTVTISLSPVSRYIVPLISSSLRSQLNAKIISGDQIYGYEFLINEKYWTAPLNLQTLRGQCLKMGKD